jgi:hypothetical protein
MIALSQKDISILSNYPNPKERWVLLFIGTLPESPALILFLTY